MGLSEAGRELWRCAAPRERAALIVVGVLFLVCFGFDLSDQPLYESVKAWGILVILAGLVWAILPATIRCASNSKMVWVVCGSSSLLLTISIVAIFLAYFWSSQAGDSPKISDRILNLPPVLAALWAAGMGWYVHFQASAKNHRTTNSFHLVMHTRTSSEFLRRAKLATSMYPHGEGIPDADKDLITSKAYSLAVGSYRVAKSGGHPTAEILDKVRRARAADAMKYLLNYYEFMAVGIGKKDLDEESLYETLSVTVCSVYERSLPFIVYMRDPEGGDQPLAFEHLQGLVDRWGKRLLEDEHAQKCRVQAAGR